MTVLVPAVQTDVTSALATQWTTWDTPGRTPPWEMCLRALDLATQAQPVPGEPLEVLSSGYYLGPPNPYVVPAADADIFWDWLAGAVRPSLSVSKAADVTTALDTAKIYVHAYYMYRRGGLIEKVDANFTGKNPRRAIFELLSFAGQDAAPGIMPSLEALEGNVVGARKTASELAQVSKGLATAKQRADQLLTQLNGPPPGSTGSISSSIDALVHGIVDSARQQASDIKALTDKPLQDIIQNAGGDNAQKVRSAADKLANGLADAVAGFAAKLSSAANQPAKSVKDALQKAIDDYVKAVDQASKDAVTAATAAAAAKKAAEDAVNARLSDMERIRLCYASVDNGVNGNTLHCRQDLAAYVAANFRTPPTSGGSNKKK
ncbi:MAG: hypothetical protein ABSF22_23185 [Bryobacteraceae bacterium]